MACRVDPDENWRDVFKEHNEALKQINILTDMLCRLCEACDLETEKLIDGAGSDIRKWWEVHKEADKKRIESDCQKCEAEIIKAENAIKEMQRNFALQKEMLDNALTTAIDNYRQLLKERERIFNRG